MAIVGEPRLDTRPERPYLGIRVRVPMKGMAGVIARLRQELTAWFAQRQVEAAGSAFVRYHVIDMAGEMDIEVGIPVATPSPGDERVRPGLLPAGRYASLVYTGSGLAGNKALLQWGRDSGLAWDRWADPRGDAFRARYETYLTDPRVEPRKTKWAVEVAITVQG